MSGSTSWGSISPPTVQWRWTIFEWHERCALPSTLPLSWETSTSFLRTPLMTRWMRLSLTYWKSLTSPISPANSSLDNAASSCNRHAGPSTCGGGGEWCYSQPDYIMANERTTRRFLRVAFWLPQYHDSDHRAVVATFWGGKGNVSSHTNAEASASPSRLPRGRKLNSQQCSVVLWQSASDPSCTSSMRMTVWQDMGLGRTADSLVAGWKVAAWRGVTDKNTNLSFSPRWQGGLHFGCQPIHPGRVGKRGGAGGLPPPEGMVQGSVEDHVVPLPSDNGTTDRGTSGAILEAGPSPGDPLPIKLQATAIPDAVPLNHEIRDAAQELTNGWVGGASKTRAEDIKLWLRSITLEEDPKKGPDNVGEGDNWRLLVSLIQVVWLRGEIPQQLTWVIVVLLPKGGGDYRGIGFLE